MRSGSSKLPEVERGARGALAGGCGADAVAVTIAGARAVDGAAGACAGATTGAGVAETDAAGRADVAAVTVAAGKVGASGAVDTVREVVGAAGS